jgi:uncharacterized protein YjbI with pentapeptide repeats
VADDRHLQILRKGVEEWNNWYRDYCDPIHHHGGYLLLQQPDLTGWDGDFLRQFDWHRFCTFEFNFNPELQDFYERHNQGELSTLEIQQGWVRLDNIKLHGANLQSINLSRIRLRGADLSSANLSEANLSGADLSGANLANATLRGAHLSGTNLAGADLSGADLSGADLSNANLSRGVLVATILDRANLTDCCVYGLAAWDVRLDGTVQKNLRITSPNHPEIWVDNLEVSQFIYLLLNNQKIRQVIETITSKAVLILGRFTAERKTVLDALRREIRELGYLPILFDFDPAASQTRMETVSTLARLSRFVVADITDAKTILQELQGIVPTAPSVPVQPILLAGQKEPGMFDLFYMYPWVLPTVYYDSTDTLLLALKGCVIEPADAKARDIMLRLEQIRGKS